MDGAELRYEGSAVGGVYQGKGVLFGGGVGWLEGVWVGGKLKRGAIYDTEGVLIGE